MTLTLAEILAGFEAYGDQHYGEGVSQREHMLQSADLALADGAPDALVAAALLHDIGHFDLAPADYLAARDVDFGHEAVGARKLATLFSEAVWRPVALHVAAKRYLCAVEPCYADALSQASQTSLVAQGGPFTDAQTAHFRTLPFAAEAVRLRRYDDGAKRTDMVSGPVERFVGILEGLAGRA